jgi:mannosyl-oligosaccharide glucosidase
MAGYGWSNYDPRTGGSQTIEDTKAKLTLTTELVKKTDGAVGPEWSLRIRGLPKSESQNTMLVFYMGSEKELHVDDTVLGCTNKANHNRTGETIRLWGYNDGLGSFELLVQPPRSTKPTGKAPQHLTSVTSMFVAASTVWRAKGQLWLATYVQFPWALTVSRDI